MVPEAPGNRKENKPRILLVQPQPEPEHVLYEEGKNANSCNTVRVALPETEEVDLEAKKTDKSLGRKLARGFTITVSPPEDIDDEISSSGCLIPDDNSMSDNPFDESEDERLPRRRTLLKEEDMGYLAPEEILPEVTLDKTESRLPSLEDMLADEELQKTFNPSDRHREVQDMLVVEDEHQKYDNILQLVQRSFIDSEWRIEAAEDKGLLDTLVLFCRQKLTIAQNPFQFPGGDFLPRSSKNFRSLASKSFSRSATNSSTEAPGGGSLSPRIPCGPSDSCDPDHRIKIAFALVLATIKLLRNLCAGSPKCQTYLHEHRIVDSLVEHIDLAVDISQRMGDMERCLGSSFPDDPLNNDWFKVDIKTFLRALIQLTTNIVSGSPKIQGHIFSRLFPDILCKMIILSEDAELLACLLHTLICKQSEEFVYNTFIKDIAGFKILYLLLTCYVKGTTLLTKNDKNSLKESDNATMKSNNICSNGHEWGEILITGLFKRNYDIHTYFFVSFMDVILETDISTFQLNQIRMSLTHTGSSQRTISGLNSRRGSCDTATLYQDTINDQFDLLLAIPKTDVIAYIFTLLEDVFSTELSLVSSTHQLKNDSLLIYFIQSIDIIQLLRGYFLIAAIDIENGVVQNVRKKDDSHGSNQSIVIWGRIFKPLTRSLTCLTAGASLLSTVDREQFIDHFGLDVITTAIKILHVTHTWRLEAFKTKDQTQTKWNEISDFLSARDLIMVIANLCYNNITAQEVVSKHDGMQALLNHAYVDDNDPLMREAAIYGIRNCSSHPNNSKVLEQLTSTPEYNCLLKNNGASIQPKSPSVIFGKHDKIQGKCTIESVVL